MGSGDAQPAAQSRMKNRMHYSHPPSPWYPDAPEDARMRPNNPKETLKSLEETRATLKAQLCAVEFYIGHLKTNVINVIHVRSPFAQRPVTRETISTKRCNFPRQFFFFQVTWKSSRMIHGCSLMLPDSFNDP